VGQTAEALLFEIAEQPPTSGGAEWVRVQMRRREFLGVLGGAAVNWPLVARAQQQSPRLRRIAILMGLPASDLEGQRWLKAFIQTLRELGWRNGTNVQIDLRWTSGFENLRTAAKELVELQPDVIHVTTGIAAAELLRQTNTIPVVFGVVNNPVAFGFTQSLQRPTGNATGFTNISSELGIKWVELLKEIAPRINRSAMLFNPVPGAQVEWRVEGIKAAGEALGIKVEPSPVRNIEELDETIEQLGQDKAAGFFVIPDTFFNLARSKLITSIASRHRVVGVYPARDFVIYGGLVSCSVDVIDQQRRAARYADRILKGETPSDLPVEVPKKFAIVINLRSANEIGLSVPSSLLARADEVIE
jgi:putative tryptophan/tyrosine transport system substrate-binding protein